MPCSAIKRGIDSIDSIDSIKKGIDSIDSIDSIKKGIDSWMALEKRGAKCVHWRGAAAEA
jgi:hypothetical protein